MPDPNPSPPAALNATMKLLLRTPFLQNVLGKYLALLSFTGRRSGKRYTIPIGFRQTGDFVLLLTKRTFNWWQNFEDEPHVQLRIAGRTLNGTARARIATGDDLDEVVAYLSERSQDAKAYGATSLPDGSLDPASVERFLSHNVLIRVQLD